MVKGKVNLEDGQAVENASSEELLQSIQAREEAPVEEKPVQEEQEPVVPEEGIGPKKYKSVDEVEKARAEAEKRMHAAIAKEKELETRLTYYERLAEQAAPYLEVDPYTGQVRPKGKPAERNYEDDLANKPVDTIQRMINDAINKAVAPIKTMTRQEQIDRKMAEVKSQYPDFGELEQDIRDSMQKELVQGSDINAVEYGYWRVKGPRLQRELEELKTKKVQDKKESKENAFIDGGGKTARPRLDTESMSAAELFKLIPKEEGAFTPKIR